MASPSKTTPSTQILGEINTLFAWNPPRLTLAPLPNEKKPSTSTRPPAFYDKHFTENLILRRVRRLPSLVQKLADNVDKALAAALDTLPPVEDFITDKQRWRDVKSLDWTVTDETGVAEFYLQTTARFCLPIASTLALHPKASFSEWVSLLVWSQSRNAAGYAIADGLLRFVRQTRDSTTIELERLPILEAMEPQTRQIFDKLRQSSVPLATWEMKSIAAGPSEIMTAIPKLGDFAWTSCRDTTCLKSQKHEKQRKKVEDVVVGADAEHPPWTLDDSAASRTRSATRLEVASSSVASMPPPPIKNPRKSTSQMKKRSGKRKRDDDHEAYKDRHDITAQSLVQQAWVQAVRVDGTIIVLHSGNHELVCLRHRKSQTLYVSDLIMPPTCKDPGYGKLHVGIFIAAIQDALDRHALNVQSQLQSPGEGNNVEDNDEDDDEDSTKGRGRDRPSKSSCGGGGRGGSGGRHGRGRGGNLGGNDGGSNDGGGNDSSNLEKADSGHRRRMEGVSQYRTRMKVPDASASIEQKTLQVATNRDVVLLYLQYGVYNSPSPSAFLRSAPSITLESQVATSLCLQPISSYHVEECQTIILTSEIGQGATGVVHHGKLEVEGSDELVPLNVVVKLAFSSEQQGALKSEYEVYRKLALKGVRRGITRTLGLFHDSEGGPYALILLYAGVSLAMMPERVLSTSERKLALEALSSIHRADILHGDIRKENILVDDFGTTIIDFGHSAVCDKQREKNNEYACLQHLLESSM